MPSLRGSAWASAAATALRLDKQKLETIAVAGELERLRRGRGVGCGNSLKNLERVVILGGRDQVGRGLEVGGGIGKSAAGNNAEQDWYYEPTTQENLPKALIDGIIPCDMSLSIA